jgi:purine-binding chemotaxis protein CheW
VCALPLEHVIETMRPLPVTPLTGVPPAVLGVAVIRGAPVPVVDVASMLAGDTARATRFVTVRTGHRAIALAFEEVVGIRSIPTAALSELPPLVSNGRGETIAAIGALDDELLIVLSAARIVPESAWRALDADPSSK